MPVDKTVASFSEAVADIPSGAMLHIGGFGGPAECPSYLIAAVARLGIDQLTITGNSSGWGPELMTMLRERMAVAMPFPEDFYDPGLLVSAGRVKKGILAFPAAPGHMELPFESALRAGEVELELLGQGTLAERARAARAGIAAFYTPVGPGTITAEGKEIRDFAGVPHVLEHALKADASLIRAHRADRFGNLVYRGTARTFNATMAGAATITIAEVDEIVEPGELDPEQIITPGPYVQRVVVRPSSPIAWDQPS